MSVRPRAAVTNEIIHITQVKIAEAYPDVTCEIVGRAMAGTGFPAVIQRTIEISRWEASGKLRCHKGPVSVHGTKVSSLYGRVGKSSLRKRIL